MIGTYIHVCLCAHSCDFEMWFFFSCCVQSFMYFGIGYSSPTLASAMTDLTPAFTFILAILSRLVSYIFYILEKLLDVKEYSHQ